MTKGLSFGITLALLILIVVCVHPTLAVNPDEVLADPVLESRAREISKGLRCLVCQNQSIDDSDADLAKDLRILVRERLSAGDSNEDVTHFVVSLYGDFILLKPPFKMSTIALWLGPLAIMLIGLVAVGVFFRRRRIAATQGQQTKPLSKDEIRRLNKFLKSDNT
jgi:cytochrome c-type biogenesis protein CcmH